MQSRVHFARRGPFLILLTVLLVPATCKRSPPPPSPFAAKARAAAAALDVEKGAPSSVLLGGRCGTSVGPREGDEELGMTESLGGGWGWGGVVALRVAWGDFRVNERGLEDGEVCELKDIEGVPPPPGIEVGAEYCRFVLLKVGRETHDVVSRIERHLHVPRGSITHAGIKDKSAITLQHACIKVSPGFDPRRLLALNTGGLLRGVIVGNLRWASSPLHPGEHAGNEFRIVARIAGGGGGGLRQLRDALVRLKSKKGGFVNYFGHQRFGGGVPAAKVGRLIVLGHYKAAVNTIFDSDYAASDEERRAKELYEGDDVHAAMEALPTNSDLRRMLSRLCQAEGGKPKHDDYRAALAAVGGGRVYQQAFWSLAWNRAASQRLKVLGTTPVAGDLVMMRDERGLDGRRHQLVRVLTEEEVRNGRVRMSHVVLPVPGQGTEMVYPENEAGSLFQSYLGEEGVMGAVGYAGRGARRTCRFRSIVARPRQLRCHMVRYAGGDAGLASALEEEDASPGGGGRISRRGEGIEVIGQGEGRALVFEFGLSAGCFATMCLRELFGISMHPRFQREAAKLVRVTEAPDVYEMRLNLKYGAVMVGSAGGEEAGEDMNANQEELVEEMEEEEEGGEGDDESL